MYYYSIKSFLSTINISNLYKVLCKSIKMLYRKALLSYAKLVVFYSFLCHACYNLSNPNKMCHPEMRIIVKLISSFPFFPGIYDDLVPDYFSKENQVRSHFIFFIPSYAHKTDRKERVKGTSQFIEMTYAFLVYFQVKADTICLF